MSPVFVHSLWRSGSTYIWNRFRALDAVTEPVLRPIRRILPPARIGGVGIDLAFLVVFVVLQFFVIPLLRHFSG